MPQDTGLSGFFGLTGETGLLCPSNQLSGENAP